MRFLESMSQGWNISLFHYRNMVLTMPRAGWHPGAGQREASFQAFLDGLGYPLLGRIKQSGLQTVFWRDCLCLMPQEA